MNKRSGQVHSGRISRRQFMQGTATAAGAVLLSACAGDQSFQPEPLTEEIGVGTGALVIYDSLYGNTKQIAEQITQKVTEILQAGASETSVKLLHADEVKPQDLAGVGLLFVGSPTHGGGFTDPVDSFFDRIPVDGLANVIAAAFDTGFSAEEEGAVVRFLIDRLGYASSRIAKKMENKGAVVAAAETFFVLGEEGPLMDGEVERAGEWAAGLLEQVLSTAGSA